MSKPSRSRRPSSTESLPRLVVGVGASAGGLEAFKQLLSALPDETGMTFLLVQHLDPTHKSLLTELLAPCTRMRVVEANHGARLEPNSVYVIRPDTALAVRSGKISLTTPTIHRGVRLPVDHLFRSLSREFGPRAVGIVLSGAGSDGSSGLRDVRAAGGLTIAQVPTSSGQSGMPQSAIDTGVVDLVLEIGDIPQALDRFANLPADARSDVRDAGPGADLEEEPSRTRAFSDVQLARLSALFEAQGDFDFRVYKIGTIERRVMRRMALAGFEDLEAYLDHLRDDPEERQALVRDLLISVTEFFRDVDAFATVRKMAIEPLVAEAAAGSVLRAWVPGCATGEEAYSIAIEFLEAIDAQHKRLSLQVFATDIDQEALAIARTGIYSPSIVDRVSAIRLQTYFKPLDGRGYQVRPVVRDAVSFAIHDLAKDPPFSRMDLVSCRNVLIYLRQETQQQVLRGMHFALNPERYLFLGPSESTGNQRDLFASVAKKWRLYRKIGLSRPMPIARGRERGAGHEPDGSGPSLPRHSPVVADRTGDLARRVVLHARVSPTIVVADDGTVIFTHGELRPYLRFPEGDNPRLTLSSIVTPTLATRTRAALYKCRKDGRSVIAESSPDVRDTSRVRITATPAAELGEGTVILTFEDMAVDEGRAESRAAPDNPAQEAIIDQLEKELQATREDLRNTVEELETSNEELRSSNEESMSMNEELQSANEELEATTEELRSLNEELTTVNAQLREKVEQLEQAHDDLSNLFSSTKIATFFLDERLCIKRFTPAAGELLRLDQADAGRFIGDIARDLLQNDLVSEARAVLEHLATQSRELQTDDGRWIVRRILPYRTENRRIEGVVVTFMDVSELKAATSRLAQRERQQAVIARLGLQALRDGALEEFLDQVVREVQQTLGTDFCKILELQPESKLLLRAGVGWESGLVGSAYVGADLDSQAGFTLQRGDVVTVDELASEKRFAGPPLLTDHGVVSGISCPIRLGDGFYGVLGAHTRTRRSFTPEDANFLQAVAGVVTTAVARHHTRTRLAIETRLSKALAGAPGPDAVLIELMDTLAAELGATLGELWSPSPEGRGLTCTEVWVRPPLDKALVQAHFSDTTVDRAEGLASLVFERGRAMWIAQLAEPSRFPNRDVARALGLVSGLAFPIVSGTSILGVVTAFSSRHLTVDAVFLKSLEGLGRSIGEFVTRTALEEQGRRLAAITASSHDAILSYDFEGRVTEWLQGATALFGYTADEMIGAPIERIVPVDKRDELNSFVKAIREGRVMPPLDTERLHKDGRRIAVSVRSSPMSDAQGRIVGVSSTDRDVSDQKEVARKLLEADRQKDEFLAMLGHELRNPLAAIRGASSVLKLANGDRAVLERTQAVLERQTDHMAKLLDGLLDVSRIVRGKITIDRDPVDFREVCAELVADVELRTGGKQLAFNVDLPDAPAWIVGDRVRLMQVADNLVSNAIKYTPEGGTISIRLTVGPELATFSVRDTGIGMAPELIPQLFQVFRQAEQNLDRAEGGLGLGLALVRGLVELHGGTVEARSDGRNTGAEFVVHLPLTAAHPVASAPIAEHARPLSVLVIEDNEDACEMLAFALQSAGHHVRTASTGQNGLALAAEVHPDVVLCDLGLPGMSGYDVAAAIRAGKDGWQPQLIALTGYGRPEDKERCRAAGFDAHLTKPVDMDALNRTLAKMDGAGSLD